MPSLTHGSATMLGRRVGASCLWAPRGATSSASVGTDLPATKRRLHNAEAYLGGPAEVSVAAHTALPRREDPKLARAESNGSSRLLAPPSNVMGAVAEAPGGENRSRAEGAPTGQPLAPPIGNCARARTESLTPGDAWEKFSDPRAVTARTLATVRVGASDPAQPSSRPPVEQVAGRRAEESRVTRPTQECQLAPFTTASHRRAPRMLAPLANVGIRLRVEGLVTGSVRMGRNPAAATTHRGIDASAGHPPFVVVRTGHTPFVVVRTRTEPLGGAPVDVSGPQERSATSSASPRVANLRGLARALLLDGALRAPLVSGREP